MVARQTDTTTSTIEDIRTACMPAVEVEYNGGQATDTATSTIENSRSMCIPVVEVEYNGGQADCHRHQHHREQQVYVYTCSEG